MLFKFSGYGSAVIEASKGGRVARGHQVPSSVSSMIKISISKNTQWRKVKQMQPVSKFPHQAVNAMIMMLISLGSVRVIILMLFIIMLFIIHDADHDAKTKMSFMLFMMLISSHKGAVARTD